jgi:adenosylcobinamide-GDP ribazoletransferase
VSGGLRSAAAFLTAVGGSRRPEPAALDWFPVVGAALGAAVGTVWRQADRQFAPGLAGGLGVAADLAGTGLLHVDGLADAADGLLAPMGRDRRLAVMRQPDVGAFGVAAVATALLVRTTALAAQEPSVLLVSGLWSLARGAMAFAVATQPYARADGLARAFAPSVASAADTAADAAAGAGEEGQRAAPPVAGSARQPVVAAAVAFLPGLALCVAWDRHRGPGVALGALLAGGGVLALARRRLGGYTGDVLGAGGVVMETVGLVLAAAGSGPRCGGRRRSAKTAW